MELRQAVEADLGLLQSITDAAYSPYEPLLGGKPLPMTDDYAARIARDEAWVAEKECQPVAMMVLEPAERHLLIVSLAVLPAQQGQGIGTWLIRLAQAKAREQALPMLRLYTNERMADNVALYRKVGFNETGRRPNPYRPGWTLVDMEMAVGIQPPP